MAGRRLTAGSEVRVLPGDPSARAPFRGALEAGARFIRAKCGIATRVRAVASAMNSRAAEYRRRAEEAEAQAAKVIHHDVREGFLKIAAEYRKMAEEAERPKTAKVTSRF